MLELKTEVLLGGRGFLEAPHWHAGALWTSDLHRREVLAVGLDGSVRVVNTFTDQPSGLGFRPDGSAVVVSMLDRRLLLVDDLSVVADLAPLTVGGTNDMIVDALGRCYVGSFGYDVFGRAHRAPGNLVLVDTDGSTRVVAEGLEFPNGMAILPDGTLLVAESHASRISAFTIAPDGSLSDRREWAALSSGPDGMTIDAQGAAWVALPRSGEVVRVLAGGEVTGRVRVRDGWRAIACGLGGPDLTTLYVTTAFVVEPSAEAAIEFAEVDVPGGADPGVS